MARYLSVDDIINRVAIEVGLLPSAGPVSDTGETFIQLVGLLNSSGQELCELNDWQVLHQTIDSTTDATSGNTVLGVGNKISLGGEYELPDDFNYMIDQTGWDQSNRLPIGGPLSSQDWTYLAGRQLASHTIYASFRLTDGKLFIFPNPAPNELRITFEYVSRNWLAEQGQTVANRDTIGAGSDTCILDPLLSIKFLKLKWLVAKGFDFQGAALEFDTLLGGRIGKSTGAAILSASNGTRGFPFLDPYRNTGDTNFGE